MSEAEKPERKHRATGKKPTGRPATGQKETRAVRIDLDLVRELEAINVRGARSFSDKLRGAWLCAQLALQMGGEDATWAEVSQLLHEAKDRAARAKGAKRPKVRPQPELPL